MTIPDLKKQFKCVVGLSDHTMGVGAALAAISHGAKIIEKHFTLNRKDGGVDSERTFMKQVVQKYCGETEEDEDLFNAEEIEEESQA